MRDGTEQIHRAISHFFIYFKKKCYVKEEALLVSNCRLYAPQLSSPLSTLIKTWSMCTPS